MAFVWFNVLLQPPGGVERVEVCVGNVVFAWRLRGICVVSAWCLFMHLRSVYLFLDPSVQIYPALV